MTLTGFTGAVAAATFSIPRCAMDARFEANMLVVFDIVSMLAAAASPAVPVPLFMFMTPPIPPPPLNIFDMVAPARDGDVAVIFFVPVVVVVVVVVFFKDAADSGWSSN